MSRALPGGPLFGIAFPPQISDSCFQTTRPSVIYEPWDVVVVPFPFTERAGTKRRPALVLSKKAFNENGHTILAQHRPPADLGPGLARVVVQEPDRDSPPQWRRCR